MVFVVDSNIFLSCSYSAVLRKVNGFSQSLVLQLLLQELKETYMEIYMETFSVVIVWFGANLVNLTDFQHFQGPLKVVSSLPRLHSPGKCQ